MVFNNISVISELAVEVTDVTGEIHRLVMGTLQWENHCPLAEFNNISLVLLSYHKYMSKILIFLKCFYSATDN